MKPQWVMAALALGLLAPAAPAQAGTSPSPEPSTIGTLARKGQIIGIVPFDGHYAPTTNLPTGRLITGLLGGAPIANAGYSTLVFRYEGKGPTQVPLLTLSGDPLQTLNGSVVGHLDSAYYAIVGEVKYENATPGTYLEMWSHFESATPGGAGATYFSRTLAPVGPLGEIAGTSDWREFWLPFDRTGAATQLTSLDVNLHFSGPGQVSLRWFKLVQFASPVWLENDAVALTGADRIVVEVSSDQGAVSYRIDGQPCPDLGTLQQTLARRHAAESDLTVVLRADKTLPHDEVVRALGAVRDSGLQRVTFESAEHRYSMPPDNIATLLRLGGALLLFGLLVLLVFLLRRHKRRQHERELRRIASLDS